ncbi:unnamed protein product, partial [Allacma fusca]
MPQQYYGAGGFDNCDGDYNNDQCPPLNFSGTSNMTTMAECLHEANLNFTRVIYQPSDYDPRIGLKINELPEFDTNYEFNSPWGLLFPGTIIFNPLKSDYRMFAKLYFIKSSVQIRCEITTPGIHVAPNILVRKCESFMECQLKFEPLWPAVFSSDYDSLKGQFEEISSFKMENHR